MGLIRLTYSEASGRRPADDAEVHAYTLAPAYRELYGFIRFACCLREISRSILGELERVTSRKALCV